MRKVGESSAESVRSPFENNVDGARMGDWHYLLSALDGTPNAGDQVGPVPWANLEREYGGGNLINESMV